MACRPSCFWSRASSPNLVQIVRADLSDRLADFRRGYVIALVGLAITLCTVHAWGATFVFVMFYIGAGSWIFTGTAGRAGRSAGSGPQSGARRDPRGHRLGASPTIPAKR